jgi:hypothetical protein
VAARLEAIHNRDKMDTWLTEKLKACHEAMKADTERTEPDPGMMQSIGEHQEVTIIIYNFITDTTDMNAVKTKHLNR